MDQRALFCSTVSSVILLIISAATGSSQTILSTDFIACGLPIPANPQPMNVDPAAVARTFKGVWLGTHADEGGITPETYAMIFDTDNGVGLAFQQIGVQNNLFVPQFPPAAPTAAHITFLFCGGRGYGPFRDTFVKVSRDPGSGLAALQNITGVSLAGLTVRQAWQTLSNAGAFTTSNNVTTTAALYSLSFTVTQNLALPISDTRITFAGEYRGSPSKFVIGQPLIGTEIGRFQGVGQGGSTVAVSVGVEPWAALCTGDSIEPLQYTKAVVGPLAPQICDVNGDGQIDRNDINAIFQSRGTAATNVDDPRDADGDGIITTNDARRCVQQCTNANCATASLSPARQIADVSSRDALARLIDEALAKIKSKELRSDTDTPWTFMHYLVAFGGEGSIYDAKRGEHANVTDFLLNRATAKGRRIFWDVEGVPRLPPRTKELSVEGHVDEYLMAFANAVVPLNRTFTADSGRTFRVSDLLHASQYGFRPDQELGWTLVALSHYLAYGAHWTANTTEYSIEELISLAIKRDARTETEGGPHHLYGIAYALSEHNQQDEKDRRHLSSTWQEATKYVRRYVDLARLNQQDDGAFSGAGFWGPAAPLSASHAVDTTGHTLEWLTIALSAEELQEGWVRRASQRLCETVLTYPLESFTTGGLYHAAHALRVYRERAFTHDNERITK